MPASSWPPLTHPGDNVEDQGGFLGPKRFLDRPSHMAGLIRFMTGERLAPEICADPPGIDRAEVHRGMNAEIVRFFSRTLG